MKKSFKKRECIKKVLMFFILLIALVLVASCTWSFVSPNGTAIMVRDITITLSLTISITLNVYLN